MLRLRGGRSRPDGFSAPFFTLDRFRIFQDARHCEVVLLPFLFHFGQQHSGIAGINRQVVRLGDEFGGNF
jgi:hypothetical protein